MKKAVLFFTLVLVSIPLVYAATTLNPGSTTFTIAPLFLNGIQAQPQLGDYCGDPRIPATLSPYFGLQGTPTSLNIRWDAETPTGNATQIGVNCYLNCGNPGNNITQNCAGVQSCSYVGPTGLHSCTISNPNYLSKQTNNITCQFYEVVNSSIQLLPYPNRTFYLYDYFVSSPTVSTTVGQPFTFKTSVTNFGLFTDNFTVNNTALQKASEIAIDRPVIQTDSAYCGQVVSVFPTVVMLVADTIPVSSQVHQTFDSNTCTTNNDCSYLTLGNQVGKCVSGVCYKAYTSTITAGLTSLPDFGIGGFLAIIFSAFVVFFFFNKYYKKFS